MSSLALFDFTPLTTSRDVEEFRNVIREVDKLLLSRRLTYIWVRCVEHPYPRCYSVNLALALDLLISKALTAINVTRFSINYQLVMSSAEVVRTPVKKEAHYWAICRSKLSLNPLLSST